MNTIVIAGNGLSAYASAEWPGLPIMGISAGCLAVPEMRHFVSQDKPMHFPKWVTDSDQFDKHVPANKFADRWRKHPRVTVWPYEELGDPTFCPDSPIVSGPLPRNDSLLFGVQVAGCLGYRRLVFIGCDLIENERWAISDTLREWWPIAKAAGMEWLNASPLSTLKEWMPRYTETIMVET